MILTKKDHDNTRRQIKFLIFQAGYLGRRGFQLFEKAEQLAKSLPSTESAAILNSLAIIKYMR